MLRRLKGKTTESFDSVVFYLFLILGVNLDDFFAIVCSAVLADTVREDHLSALGASDHSGEIESFLSCASSVATCCGNFSFRYCHVKNLLLIIYNFLFFTFFFAVVKKAFKSRPTGIYLFRLA